MTTRLSTAVRNAKADAAVDFFDAGGYIEIRTGEQPASVEDEATGTLLVTIPLAVPAFGAASNGTAAADVDPEPEGTGVAGGDAGWFRAYDDGDNPVCDGSAGTSGTDMILSTATVSVGLAVKLTSWTHTQPAG